MDSDLRCLVRLVSTLSPEEKQSFLQQLGFFLLPLEFRDSLLKALQKISQRPLVLAVPPTNQIPAFLRSCDFCQSSHYWEGKLLHLDSCMGMKMLKEMERGS